MTAAAEKVLQAYRSVDLEGQFEIANSIVKEWSDAERPMLPAVWALRPSADYGTPPAMTDQEIAELQNKLKNLREEDLISAEQMLELIEKEIQEENQSP